MTKHSWSGGNFGSCAVVRLRAALLMGVVMGLTFVALPALARPVRLIASRAAHHAQSYRVATRRTASENRTSAKASKRGRKNSAGKSRSAAASASHSAKSKHHKLRQRDEEDNDPPVIYRTGARGRKLQRDVVPQQIATYRRDEEVLVPHARKRASDRHRAVEEPVETKKTVSSDDFTRAAGGGVPVVASDGSSDLVEGVSHPEDDERLPMSAGNPVETEAVVSAAPEPITPAGKATLPEKLHSAAVKVETDAKVDAASLTGRKRAKTNFMPDDEAGRAAVIDQAMTPVALPALYTRYGRLIVPPPMKGSREILVHQNVMADNDGLDRIQNDDDLDHMRALHLLVPLRSNTYMVVNEELPLNRRYARPWTARFVADTSRAFYSRFHQPLRLNSAVRTVEYQLRLQRVNGNAAAVDGDGASPHLTGQAIDFGKRGMSVAQIAWMRAYLAPLMQAGKIDVEEEFQQACFHISAYRSYAPRVKARKAPRVEVAQARGDFPIRRSRY